MLKGENRLTKVRDFNLLVKHGRYLNGKFLDFKYLDLGQNVNFVPKKELPESFVKQLRLAVIVSTKIAKSAVVRNRVKRQVREIIRLFLKNGLVGTGRYVLVMVKRPAIDADRVELSQEIKLLLNKAKVLLG